MHSHKDAYIELLVQGYVPQDIDDELLCQMMDEEREALELQHELEMEQKERHKTMTEACDALKAIPPHVVYRMGGYLNERGE